MVSRVNPSRAFVCTAAVTSFGAGLRLLSPPSGKKSPEEKTAIFALDAGTPGFSRSPNLKITLAQQNGDAHRRGERDQPSTYGPQSEPYLIVRPAVSGTPEIGLRSLCFYGMMCTVAFSLSRSRHFRRLWLPFHRVPWNHRLWSRVIHAAAQQLPDRHSAENR